MKQNRFRQLLPSFVSLVLSCSAISCSAEQQGNERQNYSQSVPIEESGQKTDTGGIPAGGTPTGGSSADMGKPSGSGASSADAGTKFGSDEICEEVRLRATRVKADMMIVLDRSGSMGDEFRWGPSVAAVRSVTQELDMCIRLGLTLFPGTTPQQVDFFGIPIEFVESCEPGEVVMPIDETNAEAISDLLDISWPEGGTPTSETLQIVLDSFTNQEVLDSNPYPQYMLLVTDGQPTCPAGNGRDVTQEDINASYAAMEALNDFGVKSYVIGYDTTGAGRESLSEVLDSLAQRGGTGDTTHRPVEDEQSLIAELQKITGDIISCDLLLDGEPSGPEYVRVRIDGNQLSLDQPDGWRFIPPNTVQLVGGACTNIKDCGQHIIEVDVLCEPLIVL